MKSVEIRESLKRGADLGSVRICTASRCQRVGGVHMMHQVPSRIMHICNDERFQCQVILYTLGACELQGSSAKLSRHLHPAILLLPQEGAPNTMRVCTFPRALLCQTSMSATPISEAKTLPARLCYTWDDMKCNAHYKYPKSMQMCEYLDFCACS